MKRITEKQRKQSQEFVTGTVGLTFRQEVHITQFEQLLSRLDLTESNCHENSECAAWCRSNRGRRYVPEIVLHRLRVKCLYEETIAPFSLIAGAVIPEPSPLHEMEDVNEETQQAT